MKRKSVFSLGLILSFSLSAFCEAYDFEALKSFTLAKNPDILSLQEEYNRSLLDVKDAWAGLGPTVELQTSGTYMTNPPVDAVYVNVGEILNSVKWPSGINPTAANQYVKVYDGMENTLYNFELSMTQPVFTWGKLENSIILYQKISQIKETQLKSKQNEISTELETRLAALVYLKRINSILDEEKTYASRMVQTSEDAEKSGMVIHQDVVDARIQAKELEISQHDVEEEINNQLLELRRITGIENLDYDSIIYEIDEEELNRIKNLNREEVEALALSGNKDAIKMVTQMTEVSELGQKIAEGYLNWKPDLALQVSASYGGSRIPFFESNWLRKDDYSCNISIGMKTVVWDGGKKLREVSRQSSNVKTALVKQDDVRSEIKKNLSSQWNSVDLCSMKIEYQDLKIESGTAKVSQKETIYNSGYGSETDVLSAKIDLCNQRIEKEKQALTLCQACFVIRYLSE